MAGYAEVKRGERTARNKWVKNAAPLVDGKRLAPRATARIQVIPEGAFNVYGDRKIAGITLSELKEVVKTAHPWTYKDRDGRVIASITVGEGDDQWTLEELREIVATVEAEGVILLESPMGVEDIELANRKKLRVIAPEVVAAPIGKATIEEEQPVKRKPGRPRKDAAQPAPATD